MITGERLMKAKQVFFFLIGKDPWVVWGHWLVCALPPTPVTKLTGSLS